MSTSLAQDDRSPKRKRGTESFNRFRSPFRSVSVPSSRFGLLDTLLFKNQFFVVCCLVGMLGCWLAPSTLLADSKSQDELSASKPASPVKDANPLAKAESLLKDEEWEEARDAFADFLKKNPASPKAPEARFWIGYCQVKHGENKEAVETLRPFEGLLAKDKYADDALLQLGRAYHSEDQKDLALAAWRRLLDQHGDSVWKADALSEIVSLLFYESHDYENCFPYCERIIDELSEDHWSEAAYIGAYCLSALNKPKEAEEWIEENFEAEESLHEAWRRLLTALMQLRAGKADDAVKTVEAMPAELADLDKDEWLDALARAAFIFRTEGRADEVRVLMFRWLPRMSDLSVEEVDWMFDEWSEAYAEAEKDRFIEALDAFLKEPALNVNARTATILRSASVLHDTERIDVAIARLRDALSAETAEPVRVAVAIRLAEFLAEKEQPAESAKLLRETRESIRRRDLRAELDTAIGEHGDHK